MRAWNTQVQHEKTKATLRYFLGLVQSDFYRTSQEVADFQLNLPTLETGIEPLFHGIFWVHGRHGDVDIRAREAYYRGRPQLHCLLTPRTLEGEEIVAAADKAVAKAQGTYEHRGNAALYRVPLISLQDLTLPRTVSQGASE